MTKRKNRISLSPREKLGRAIKFLFLFVMALIVIIPFLWMILTSLMPDSKSLLIRPFRFPWPPAFSNYVEVFRTQPFGIYFFNSIFTSVISMLISIVTALLAGYAFVFLDFPCKRFLFMMVLGVLMMPSTVSIVSLYVTMSKIGWLDTYWALIIPFAADAYGVYLIKQNLESIPKDFIESAKIDGAGHVRILFQIMTHLASPSLIAYGIMSFKWRWNDYFWVLMMTSSKEMRTLPVGLVMMRNEDGGTQWQLIMAATAIVILPMIILYIVVQKGFNNDYVAGGIKG